MFNKFSNWWKETQASGGTKDYKDHILVEAVFLTWNKPILSPILSYFSHTSFHNVHDAISEQVIHIKIFLNLPGSK